MPVREGPPQPAPSPKDEQRHEPTHEPPPYPADKARGGEIILRSRAQRVIFIAGPAGAVVLVLLLKFFA